MLLHDVIEASAEKRPGQTGLIFADRRYTYAELGEAVSRASAAIAAITAPGDRVAIISDNCPEYIECLYAVPAAGAILTMVNQRLSGPEIAHVLADSEPSVVIAGSQHLERLAEQLGAVESVRHIICIGGGDSHAESYESLVERERADVSERRRVDEDDVAWLIYTSGTTGRPKGVMLTHRSILAGVLNSMIEFRPLPADTYLFCFPLCHIAAYMAIIYAIRGATVLLTPGFDVDDFLRLVPEHKVTHAGLAPTMLSMVLDHPGAASADLSSISMVIYGSAPMAPALLQRGVERFGSIFMHTYGMTELSGNVVVLSLADHRRSVAGESHLLDAAGRPGPLVRLRIVDEWMNDVAPGEVGEIVVRGDQVMKGYWRQDALTHATFAGGWLHTGDLARTDEDGIIYIVDRLKDMVITGGENVYPREVEEVLLTHPSVSDVAVVGLPDPLWGESVTAVLPVAPGSDAPSEEELVAYCRERLAGFKVPKSVAFVPEFPRTGAGKIKKRALKELVIGSAD